MGTRLNRVGSPTRPSCPEKFSVSIAKTPTVFVLPQEQGRKLRKTMLQLERQGLEAMEEILTSAGPLDPAEVGDLFYDCVDTEIKFFK